MRDLKGRLKAKLGLRSSIPPSVRSVGSADSVAAVVFSSGREEFKAQNVGVSAVKACSAGTPQGKENELDAYKVLLAKSQSDFSVSSEKGEDVGEGIGGRAPQAGSGAQKVSNSSGNGVLERFPDTAPDSGGAANIKPINNTKPPANAEGDNNIPTTTVEGTSPLTTSDLHKRDNLHDRLRRQTTGTSATATGNEDSELEGGDSNGQAQDTVPTPTSLSRKPTPGARPAELIRRQSLLPAQQTGLINALVKDETAQSTRAPSTHTPSLLDGRPGSGLSRLSSYAVAQGEMSPHNITPMRKIWVRRPNSSATLVAIHENDLVDDVRSMILKKYANSLGRSFDAPDVTLKIIPREHRQERLLGPEEPMARMIDAVYPGGQSVHEALIIDVPVRRTPRASPRAIYYAHDEVRPSEAGDEYFPPMPVTLVPSSHATNGVPPVPAAANPPHPMSILSTGYVPSLPSPGNRRYNSRPRVARVPTSSPSVAGDHAPPLNGLTENRSRTHSLAPDHSSGSTPPLTATIPTPPIPDVEASAASVPPVRLPPIPSTPQSIPGPPPRRKKKLFPRPTLPSNSFSSAAVPPINVLIVEDNIINLKLLEAFMKRLKVRWQTAMNGKEAMTKWRAGGFHLVLMDIQLPVMNGLEATREIRRLERVNGIGVFCSSASSKAPELNDGDEDGGAPGGPKNGDRLERYRLFKSPVIIVALTASSLQSDRHEALAAGCNDFLTKVSFPPALSHLPFCFFFPRVFPPSS